MPIFRLYFLKPYSSLTGYANELNFRRDDDKSFSAFGNDYPGSTWYVNAHFFIFKVQLFNCFLIQCLTTENRVLSHFYFVQRLYLYTIYESIRCTLEKYVYS